MKLNDVLINLGIEAANLNGLTVYFDESKQAQQISKGAKRSKGGQNLAAMAIKNGLENKYNFRCEKYGYIEAVKLQKRKTKSAKEAILAHFEAVCDVPILGIEKQPAYLAYMAKVNQWHNDKLEAIKQTYFKRID